MVVQERQEKLVQLVEAVQEESTVTKTTAVNGLRGEMMVKLALTVLLVLPVRR